MLRVHVVPDARKWIIKVLGSKIGSHLTFSEAEAAAKGYLAAHGGGELVVHSVAGVAHPARRVAGDSAQ